MFTTRFREFGVARKPEQRVHGRSLGEFKNRFHDSHLSHGRDHVGRKLFKTGSRRSEPNEIINNRCDRVTQLREDAGEYSSEVAGLLAKVVEDTTSHRRKTR